LAPDLRAGFGAFLARDLLGHEGALADLDEPMRDMVVDGLKRTDLLADPERLERLPAQRLAEVDEAVAEAVQAELVDQLRADLAAKTMEELPAEIRQAVHRALEERDYFVDPEKVGWYERKTLAQLPTDLIRDLELGLGTRRLSELDTTGFRDLPSDTQATLTEFFDQEGLLPDRAERLRLTQTGSLADLSEPDRTAVARFLGRSWFVRIRDRRPPDLPAEDQQAVWVCLRQEGHFVDEFKEELFDLQRLAEFDAETQEVVERALVDGLRRDLETRPIGELPASVQTTIRAHLRQADSLLDHARVQQAIQVPVERQAPELGQAILGVLGDHLVAQVGNAPIAQLPTELQTKLWRYLDQTGYLVDEKARSQFMDRRLIDVGSELYTAIAEDLAQHLEQEIGEQPISDLDEELRTGLREAVESSGYFESAEQRHQILSQPLQSLRREDLETLAAEFGRVLLESRVDTRLQDLPQDEREGLLSHLQRRDWFLDEGRLEQLKRQRLADLVSQDGGTAPEALRQKLVDALCQDQTEELAQQRLGDLGRDERLIAHQALREQGLASEESQMRSLHPKEVQALDRGVYGALLEDLGSQGVASWSGGRFRDLPADERALLSAYLGRQLMGRIERRILLHTISRLWIDYLTDIEDLRRGIGLEAYGQRDPLVEYKRRAYELFAELGDNIRRAVVRSMFRHLPEPLAAE
jgi:hypothetical protein